ncbi:MAG TPA: cupredoxin domain-containing protein [Elusimicrobiota bacterium]|nr:cupredoxin domain-containing protein [Elusimicrobiota bacterium]
MAARARVFFLATIAGALLASGCSKSSPAAGPAAGGDVVRISAKKFEFIPSKVTLKRGRTVTLELTSLDRKHGFLIPALKLRADIPAGGSARVTLTPDKLGTFAFRCDLFCGTGHDGMTGAIEVVE